MILPKVREIGEALRSFFSAPYTTPFPFKPHDAVEESRGKPRYNTHVCVGCGTCAQVCPPKAITITDDIKNNKRELVVNYAACMMCGQCEEKCITKTGIKLTTEYSTATLDINDPNLIEKIEKDLLICETCGVVIGCQDHLSWITDRLGEKAYAHPNLLMQTQTSFSPPAEAHVKSQIRREDQVKTVCANCRFKIVTADEF